MLLSHCARWRRATCQALWTPVLSLLTSASACRQPVASPVLLVLAGSAFCSELGVPEAWVLHGACVAAPCASVCGSVKAAALRAFSREAADRPRPGHMCRNSSRHTVSEVPTCTRYRAQKLSMLCSICFLQGKQWHSCGLGCACVLHTVQQAHASSTLPSRCNVVRWPGGANSITPSRQAVR